MKCFDRGVARISNQEGRDEVALFVSIASVPLAPRGTCFFPFLGVIVVPVYFNQAERLALLSAASLGGLNVLQLMSEPLAASLNYGMFRRKEINGTTRFAIFHKSCQFYPLPFLISAIWPHIYIYNRL